jgi:DNA-binding GntR family transcriptional regulator
MSRPRTIAQSVAEQIREQILAGEIKGGEPLRQQAIARRFDTSIIPVREALRQLEAEGLVELKSHRGAVATELTLEKAREWINLRRLIETDLISAAIDSISDEDLTRAEQVLDHWGRAMNRRVDIDHWSDYNFEFHSILYAPAGRPETMKILAVLHQKCDRYIRLQLLSGDHIKRADTEHRALIDLCRSRDKRAAKSLLNEHIMGVEQDIVDTLSQ